MDLNEIKAAAKEAVAPVMTSFEEFKATNDARLKEIEKKGAADPLLGEKLGRIETELQKYEGINQKITLIEQQAKAAKEAGDRLEVAMGRIAAGSGTKSASESKAEYKAKIAAWGSAVYRAHAVGEANLTADERKMLKDVADEAKALNVGTDTAGGYLAPVEYVREIIKGITLMSPIRSIARVRNTAAKAIQVPKRTGQHSAVWTTEQGTRAETTGLAYGLDDVPVHECYALIDISNQMLEDAAFDMEAEVRGEAEEQFAVAEGTACVTGSGIGKPEGFMTNSGVGENVSGTAATIADADGGANGLLTLKHAIKSGYARNALWAMNRTTIGSVRKLKDANKNYIWVPGIANGAPNTIDGDPYVEMPDMASEAANAYPIAYGDFRRAYLLVDRIVMEMLRDPYTQATSGNIRFIFRRRVGGKVMLAEAIRKLKCST